EVRIFVKQVDAFRQFIIGDTKPADLVGDAALAIMVGKCFSTIVYAQLIAENCVAAGVSEATVSLIFHGLIQDLTEEGLELMAMFAADSPTRVVLRKIVQLPSGGAAEFEPVF